MTSQRQSSVGDTESVQAAWSGTGSSLARRKNGESEPSTDKVTLQHVRLAQHRTGSPPVSCFLSAFFLPAYSPHRCAPSSCKPSVAFLRSAVIYPSPDSRLPFPLPSLMVHLLPARTKMALINGLASATGAEAVRVCSLAFFTRPSGYCVVVMDRSQINNVVCTHSIRLANLCSFFRAYSVCRYQTLSYLNGNWLSWYKK